MLDACISKYNKMPELVPILDRETIAEKVADLARQISVDYKELNLVVIGVLKGAFIFMADLVRQIRHENLTMDFVQAASYGCNTETSGCIRIVKDIQVDIKGKDLLIVEDILDSGLTAVHLKKHFMGMGPKSVKLCAFLDKRGRRQVDLTADYVGHSIEDGFLVGYGMDHAEVYRNLSGIFRCDNAGVEK